MSNPTTACDCIEQLDDALKNKGVQVNATIPLDGTQPKAVVNTVKVSGRGKSPVVIPAAFCPFCGQKYAGGGDARG